MHKPPNAESLDSSSLSKISLSSWVTFFSASFLLSVWGEVVSLLIYKVDAKLWDVSCALIHAI